MKGPDIMVKFIDVDPDEIPNHREGRRGRVSYPILKSFLETDKYIARLDRTGMQQSFQSLYSSLNAYIRSHDMPVRIFSRSGELYLMRTDINAAGEEVEAGDGLIASEGRVGVDRHMEASPLDAREVEVRFAEEIGQTTK